ncbi:hypothetical protein FOA52_015772 [Chlamydomonas sp. UWO 241]|nr:hypothetical protein FOA52_015772 [Chlamydomonas sp. UWO 241]
MNRCTPPLMTYTPEAVYSAVFQNMTGPDEDWRGYAGSWHIGGPGGPGPLQPPMRAMRVWRSCGGEQPPVRVAHTNVYKGPAPFPDAVPRPQDGLLQASYARSVADPQVTACCDSVTADVAGYPRWATQRMVALSPDVNASLRPAVPTRPVSESEFPVALQPGSRPGSWGSELFLVDGEDRWSLVSAWDTERGGRTTIALISEAFVRLADIDAPLSFDSLPGADNQRPRLPANPKEWLGGATSASVHSFGAAVDHASGRLAPTAVGGDAAARVDSWPPRELGEEARSRDGTDLLLLPDAMYALLPSALPAFLGGSGGGGGGRPWRLEFGGLMRSSGGPMQVRRTVIEHDGSTGSLASYTHETFVAQQ